LRRGFVAPTGLGRLSAASTGFGRGSAAPTGLRRGSVAPERLRNAAVEVRPKRRLRRGGVHPTVP
jgi:hypothetical protein